MQVSLYIHKCKHHQILTNNPNRNRGQNNWIIDINIRKHKQKPTNWREPIIKDQQSKPHEKLSRFSQKHTCSNIQPGKVNIDQSNTKRTI